MLRRWLLLGSAVLMAVAPTLAQTPSVPPVAEPPAADSYYGAGNRIEVASPVLGDVVVAGRNVDITSAIAGDILAAGWRVAVTGQTTDDVRIAAGEVRVDAPIDGDLTAAGSDLAIGPKTHVTGRAWLTGGHVVVNGIFDRELQIAGGTVQIGGEFRKPLTIVAEKLELLPTARVLAPMTYKSPAEAAIADGATVTGPVAYTRIEPREAKQAHSLFGFSTILFTLHMTVVGLLLLVIAPRLAPSVVTTMRAMPGKSLLIGLALLVVTPFAALLLVISLIGIPPGITVGALYVLALPLAVLATAFFLGDVEARWFKMPVATRRQQSMVLLAGVLTFAVLRSVPAVGPLVVFASVLFGLGAMSVRAYQEYAS